MAIQFRVVRCRVVPKNTVEIRLALLADNDEQAKQLMLAAMKRRGIVYREGVHALEVVAAGQLTGQHVRYIIRSAALKALGWADKPAEVLGRVVDQYEEEMKDVGEGEAPAVLMVHINNQYKASPIIVGVDEVAARNAAGWAVYLPNKLAV